jgi:hypothetical protein
VWGMRGEVLHIEGAVVSGALEHILSYERSSALVLGPGTAKMGGTSRIYLRSFACGVLAGGGERGVSQPWRA